MFILIVLQIAVCAYSAYQVYRFLNGGMVPKTKYFLSMGIATFLFALGFLLELCSVNMQDALAGQRMANLGMLLLPVLFYFFVRGYNGRTIQKHVRVLLFVLPCVIIVSAYAYPYSTLYYVAAAYDNPFLGERGGPFYYAGVVYCAVLSGLAVYELIAHYPYKNKRKVVVKATFLMMGICPWIVAVIAMLAQPGAPEVASVMVVVCYGMMTRVIQKEVQQEQAVGLWSAAADTIPNAIVLLDVDKRYADANTTAKMMFPALCECRQGTRLKDLEGFPLDAELSAQSMQDVAVKKEQETRWLRPSMLPVGEEGHCLLFEDVTTLHSLRRQTIEQDEKNSILEKEEFMQYAERSFDLLRRLGMQSVMLVVDIDHMKSVNRAFGREVGDEVVRRTEQVIIGRMRCSDALGRIKGGKYCVFLPATNFDGACFIAEDLMREMRETPVCADGCEVQPTMSIGMARLEKRHNTVKELLDEAETALYWAKQTGRDNMKYYGQKISGALFTEDGSYFLIDRSSMGVL
ncbi:diguanylate cyclase [Christensenellaceae bacterium OttesenSCG-928-K19]|nr:diguanylate cyclase [Christensenellaceae bacterium OttesenSCG-928-K19]